MSNMSVMYGLPPDNGDRIPPFPPVWPIGVTPDPLHPCAKCNRHIRETECPFCFATAIAEAVAKAPSRAALEAVKKSLEEALRVVSEALK